MRILRSLVGGLAVLASTAFVVFVSADRLAHLAPSPAARTVQAEPSATGSIPAPVEAAAGKLAAAKPAAPAIPNGFDTERLHALMRGDPILPRR